MRYFEAAVFMYTYYGLRDEYAPEYTTELIFHLSVRIIQGGAFDGCDSLGRITIPDHVTGIEGHAFYGCYSLKSIRFPPNLEFIGNEAFSQCSSLEAVFLPPTVTHISREAFLDCKSLRYIYVSERIAHVGDDVFEGCDRLLAAVSNNYNNNEVIQRLPTCHSINLAPALSSPLKGFKCVFKNTELNALRKMTINK